MRQFVTKQLDWLGIGASTACLIHCLATPVVLSVLSAFVANRWRVFDVVFVAVATVAVVLVSQSASARVRWLLWVGLGLFYAGVVLHESGPLWHYMHLPGSLFIIAGHVVNLRDRASCSYRPGKVYGARSSRVSRS